ncbi:hypothetical protein [Bradyrhizobium sp. SZCCHNRI3037]|uniref:hypothetical protein n=1 Tax=Bradyrhizobium sp. SZCCHNRI3037 TaxID=3057290 RepID=UPI0029162417|nr:hypothetical protein [Bradyrhizobium sp. SZCCHNRI3037]
MRLLNIAVLVITLGGTANAETSYTVDGWPPQIDKIPCDAWASNSDGSVKQVATIIVNADELTVELRQNTFVPTSEIARAVNRKCFANNSG